MVYEFLGATHRRTARIVREKGVAETYEKWLWYWVPRGDVLLGRLCLCEAELGWSGLFGTSGVWTRLAVPPWCGAFEITAR